MSRYLPNGEDVRSSLNNPRQERVVQRVYHAVLWELQIAPELLVKVIEE